MSALEAFALGALQGFAEFLPVSSSGHLTIAERAFGMTDPAEMVALDVALHAATLAAMLVYFGGSWARALVERPGLVGFVAVASLPPVALYLAAGGVVEAVKESLLALGLAFVVSGSAVAVVSRCSMPGTRALSERSAMPWLLDALGLGAAQAAALLPGVSRSGMAMSALTVARLPREEAFELAFLAGAPLMAGALLVKAPEVKAFASASGWSLALGALAAFCAGLAALALFRRFLARGRLWVFGVYAAFVGIACIAWSIGGAR